MFPRRPTLRRSLHHIRDGPEYGLRHIQAVVLDPISKPAPTLQIAEAAAGMLAAATMAPTLQIAEAAAMLAQTMIEIKLMDEWNHE